MLLHRGSWNAPWESPKHFQEHIRVTALNGKKATATAPTGGGGGTTSEEASAQRRALNKDKKEERKAKAAAAKANSKPKASN